MGLNVGFVSTGEPVNWARESVVSVQDSQHALNRIKEGYPPFLTSSTINTTICTVVNVYVTHASFF